MRLEPWTVKRKRKRKRKKQKRAPFEKQKRKEKKQVKNRGLRRVSGWKQKKNENKKKTKAQDVSRALVIVVLCGAVDAATAAADLLLVQNS